MLHLNYNIRLIRKLSGKKQDEFVLLFKGVSVPMQKSYESGKAKPDIVYMQRLADYAGVNQKDLMGKQLRIDDVKLKTKVEKVDAMEKEKPGQLDDRAALNEAMATIRGYNVFLQRMLESSLEKMLKDQVDNSVLTGELLRRDFRREASGNSDVLRQIVEEFLQRSGPKLSSNAQADIGTGADS